jgi:hypothetical protein
VSFKFGGVDKHFVLFCFVCLVLFCFCIKFFVFALNFFFFLFAMLLIGHNLHRNYGLHVIGVFNLFEHGISLGIPVFDSCVGLERLHLLDRYFTCTLALGSVGYEI